MLVQELTVSSSGSFDMAFWPSAPSARCAFSVSASTGYPVSVGSNSTVCLFGGPQDVHNSDMTSFLRLMESSTVGFQLIVPDDATEDSTLVFVLEIQERWICFKGICTECLHWSQHNMTIDKFVWNGDGRKYIGPTDFCLTGYFSHV